MEPIREAAKQSEMLSGNRLTNAVTKNVRLVAKSLKRSNGVMRRKAELGIRVIGGVYDLASGQVKFITGIRADS